MTIRTFDPSAPEAAIRREAAALGFDAVGVAGAEAPEVWFERLKRFVALGHHGDMGWLEGRAEARANPRTLWPEAQSVIMLGMNYGPEQDPLKALEKTDNGVISVYAQNKDYHDVVKKRLKRLARFIADNTGAGVKVFVDTAPVMEKPLAEQAGLGWQGKHTNLVSRDYGSWLFLGAVFTTLKLSPDAPEADHCGSCQACLDICPTDAFPAPYQLDARKCISYLTIEHKGPIPDEYREPIGNRIYGCDDCLAACPWNKFAERAQETAFHARDALASPALADLAALDDTAFRALFSGSPIKRTGRDRFIRNVMIAVGNANNPNLLQHAVDRVEDESPLVRGAAIWAIWRLCPATYERLKSAYAANETDPEVRREWERAC